MENQNPLFKKFRQFSKIEGLTMSRNDILSLLDLLTKKSQFITQQNLEHIKRSGKVLERQQEIEERTQELPNHSFLLVIIASTNEYVTEYAHNISLDMLPEKINFIQIKYIWADFFKVQVANNFFIELFFNVCIESNNTNPKAWGIFWVTSEESTNAKGIACEIHEFFQKKKHKNLGWLINSNKTIVLLLYIFLIAIPFSALFLYLLDKSINLKIQNQIVQSITLTYIFLLITSLFIGLFFLLKKMFPVNEIIDDMTLIQKSRKIIFATIITIILSVTGSFIYDILR